MNEDFDTPVKIVENVTASVTNAEGEYQYMNLDIDGEEMKLFQCTLAVFVGKDLSTNTYESIRNIFDNPTRGQSELINIKNSVSKTDYLIFYKDLQNIALNNRTHFNDHSLKHLRALFTLIQKEKNIDDHILQIVHESAAASTANLVTKGKITYAMKRKADHCAHPAHPSKDPRF